MEHLFLGNNVVVEVRGDACSNCFMYAGDGCSAGMSRSRTVEREILRREIFEHFKRGCESGHIYRLEPVQAELFPTPN